MKGEPRAGGRVSAETYKVPHVWTNFGVMNRGVMAGELKAHLQEYLSKAGVTGMTLVIWDSASSHVTKEVLRTYYAENMPVVVVPAAMTMHVQFVDTDLAAAFRRFHTAEWRPHQGVKYSAKKKRALLGEFVLAAHEKAVLGARVVDAFRRLGYFGDSGGVAPKIRHMDDYVFVPPPVDPAADTAALQKKISDAAAAASAAGAAAASAIVKRASKPAPKLGRPARRDAPRPPGQARITSFFQASQSQASP